MNNEAIASILPALTGNNNATKIAMSLLCQLGQLGIAQPAQAAPAVDQKIEQVKNLSAIADRCMTHFIIGQYVNDDQKNKVNQIVATVNYLGNDLTDSQKDKIIKDLTDVLNDIEQNIMGNLTQVLQSAGIR